MDSKDVQAAINLYYKLFDNSINSMLQSNMLTDEDSEVLQSHWHQYKLKPTHKAFCSLTSICCLSGVYSLCNSNSVSAMAIASLAPMTMYMFIKYNEYKRNKDKELKIGNLLKCLKQYNELNHIVVDYYEQRYSVLFGLRMESSRLFIKMMAEKSEEFLFNYVDRLFKFVLDLMLSISQLKKYCNIKELNHYQSCLKWDLKDFYIRSTDINIVTENFKELGELCILLTSNFLACLGLTFCFDLWRADGCDINMIFEEVIPNITKSCKTVYDEMNEKFTHIRFNMPQVVKRKPVLQVVQLEKPLLEFLNQLQIIFDIGEGLERTLLKDKLKNIDSILEYIDIMSLRYTKCQAAILAMQKMMVKYKKDTMPIPFENVKDRFEMLENNECQVATVRYDDSIEAPKDEEYELSVDRIEEAEEAQGDTEEVFENAENYRFVLQELNDKLHTIRKIKGIDDARSAEISGMMPAPQGTCQIPEKNLLKPIPVHGPPPIPPFEQPENAESEVSVPQDSDESDAGSLARAIQQHASWYNLVEETFSYES